MVKAQDMVNEAVNHVGFRSGVLANKFNLWYVGLNWGDYAWAWCQAFASYVAEQCGAVSLVPRTAHCQTALEWFKARRQYGEEPRIGAQVFFDWGDGGQADHVGIVEDITTNNIYTVEGNTGNYPGEVARRMYSRGSGYILGYGYPAYDNATVDDNSSGGKSLDDVAAEVIKGKWGVGGDRRSRLLNAGYDADAVQYRVNEILGSSNNPAAVITKPEFWVTARLATTWRDRPGTNGLIMAQYAAGARVLCKDRVVGQDPYGTGQNVWYQSANRGLYCWQGTVE